MISLVVTSCGRFNLLKRTIKSFMEFNDVPIGQIVLIDDSGKKEVHKQIEDFFKFENYDPDVYLLLNKKNMGQVWSIDCAYDMVTNPYIFHLEDDWEFCRTGFMSKSLAILEACPKILTVWLRGVNDTNTHPVEDAVFQVGSVQYRYMALGALGGNWDGFTWNPGLRRLADYKLEAPYASFIRPNDFAALTECRIGKAYTERQFRAVTLLDKYCTHIG